MSIIHQYGRHIEIALSKPPRPPPFKNPGLSHIQPTQRWGIQGIPKLRDGRLWQLLRELRILIHNSKNEERKHGFAIDVSADTTGQKREMATDDAYY